jgi:hypothetical protein
MDENISRAAGAAHGQLATPRSSTTSPRPQGRTAVQRTTLYGPVTTAPTPPASERSADGPPDRLQGLGRAVRPPRPRRARGPRGAGRPRLGDGLRPPPAVAPRRRATPPTRWPAWPRSANVPSGSSSARAC